MDAAGGEVEIRVKNKPNNAERLNAQFKYETGTNANGNKILKPSAKIRLNSQTILETQSRWWHCFSVGRLHEKWCWKSAFLEFFKGELVLRESIAGIGFDGQGSLTWKDRRHNLETRGSKNESTFSLVLNSEYEISPGNTAYIRWNSVLSNAKTQTGGHRMISVTLETSEYPDYNLGASWKQQVSPEKC